MAPKCEPVIFQPEKSVLAAPAALALPAAVLAFAVAASAGRAVNKAGATSVVPEKAASPFKKLRRE
jgi:hypothetical protein